MSSQQRVSTATNFMVGRIFEKPDSDVIGILHGYRKVMSTHLETSEPSPVEIVMQPRTFCCVVSRAQIE